MAVHGVIALAAIFFAYETFRAAERLMIPRRLYGELKDAECHSVVDRRSRTNTIRRGSS